MDKATGMQVLIIDDCLSDTKLMQLWFRDSPSIENIEVQCGGRAALQYLRGQGDFKDRPLPDLVLLDSNLPDMHGLEVLAEIKHDPHLAKVAVFMMSGSFSPDDARRAKELGADQYLIKPFEADDFAALVKKVEEHWSDRAR